jgi:hypothetical protein
MAEVLGMQKGEANHNFAKFIRENYEDWLNEPKGDKPILSHQLMKKKVFPLVKEDPLFFLLIDNLRYDQWKVIEPIILEYFNLEEESAYYSILPTTTAFSRNAIFSGLLPSEMEKQHPDLWVNDDNDEEGRNNHEEEFFQRQLSKNRLNFKASYQKIITNAQGKSLVDNFNNLMGNQLNAIVYNFVDMLSHARTDMAMIRELAPDEAAYRSITRSWLEHSPLIDFLRKVSEKKGKNLGFDQSDDVLVVRKPERFFLPKLNVSTAYVFTTMDNFFAYPNNYNYYVNYYKDTFQHGGISLEEMIIPFVYLTAK